MIGKERQKEIMRLLIELCQTPMARGDEPFVAALVDNGGQVLFTAENTEHTEGNPALHAEMNLLAHVCTVLGKENLKAHCLFTNAEPCSMCASAWLKAGVRRFYYGAEMEQRCDPLLPFASVAAAAKGRVEITGGICKTSCKKQIAQGRKLLAKAGR